MILLITWERCDLKVNHTIGLVQYPCSDNNVLPCVTGISNALCVGERSRIQKKSCLCNENPRSSNIDFIQGLGLSSPTVAAEEELVKRRGCSGSSRSRTPTNSPSNRSPRRRSSSKKDQSYDPSTGIHTSGTEIRQRSAVQRRTPPRKLEVENPNGFRIRTASNPGSNVEQLATRERGGRPRDLCVSLPPFGSPYIGV